MMIGKAGEAKTSISTADASSITVRGEDLSSGLIGLRTPLGSKPPRRAIQSAWTRTPSWSRSLRCARAASAGSWVTMTKLV